MSRRGIVVLVAIAALAITIWRSQLFTVSAPGETPQPLRLIPEAEREPFAGDVVLPVVPVGLQRLHGNGGVAVIHYWAPWEEGSLEQAQALDSLRRTAGLESVQAWLVTFDPFPSVARYVGRNRLAVPVLMDGHRELRRVLPCPSIPYTYVIDAEGRVAVAQPGRVDWEAAESREVLGGLLRVKPSGSRPAAEGPARQDARRI
jgi:peroxiredoxin